MKKKTKFVCPKCLREDFKSERGLGQHDSKSHPYVRPPAPTTKTETAPGEEFNDVLLNARGEFSIGDVVWLGRKCVITRLTMTDGSNNLAVTLKVTKRWYSATELV